MLLQGLGPSLVTGGQGPRHRGRQCAGRGQADGSGERRLRRGLCGQLGLGPLRAAASLPGPWGPQPPTRRLRKDRQPGSKEGLFILEGAHALWLVGQTAMSGRWVRIWAEGKADRPPGRPRQGQAQSLDSWGFPAGMRGLSRGALLRGTGPPSSDRPPQDIAGQRAFLSEPLP